MNTSDVDMRDYSGERLLPQILEQLKRLGCTIASPQEPPEPRIISSGARSYTIPEAYRQFIEDITWPKGFLAGRVPGGQNYWSLEFLDEYRLFRPRQACMDTPDAEEERLLKIGRMDGGNYSLLLDLQDPRPSNPRFIRLADDADPIEVLANRSHPSLHLVLSHLSSEQERHDDEHLIASLDGEDEHKFEQAISTIRHELKYVSPPVIDALLRIVQQGRASNVRVNEALSALQYVGSNCDESLPALIKIASSPEPLGEKGPDLRKNALRALGKLDKEYNAIASVALEILNRSSTRYEEFLLKEQALESLRLDVCGQDKVLSDVFRGPVYEELIAAICGAIRRADVVDKPSNRFHGMVHCYWGPSAAMLLGSLDEPTEEIEEVLVSMVLNEKSYNRGKALGMLSERLNDSARMLAIFKEVFARSPAQDHRLMSSALMLLKRKWSDLADVLAPVILDAMEQRLRADTPSVGDGANLLRWGGAAIKLFDGLGEPPPGLDSSLIELARDHRVAPDARKEALSYLNERDLNEREPAVEGFASLLFDIAADERNGPTSRYWALHLLSRRPERPDELVPVLVRIAGDHESLDAVLAKKSYDDLPRPEERLAMEAVKSLCSYAPAQPELVPELLKIARAEKNRGRKACGLWKYTLKTLAEMAELPSELYPFIKERLNDGATSADAMGLVGAMPAEEVAPLFPRLLFNLGLHGAAEKGYYKEIARLTRSHPEFIDRLLEIIRGATVEDTTGLTRVWNFSSDRWQESVILALIEIGEPVREVVPELLIDFLPDAAGSDALGALREAIAHFASESAIAPLSKVILDESTPEWHRRRAISVVQKIMETSGVSAQDLPGELAKQVGSTQGG